MELNCKIGDLVTFNNMDVEVLEIRKVFGINKVRVRVLKSNEVLEIRADQLKCSENNYNSAKLCFCAIAGKIKSEVLNQKILSPYESNIIPLPHQILALEKIMSGQFLRYLLADEVGMGKTIEAGLVLKELKLRGIVKRTMIIVGKTAMLQWQEELKRHFNEIFHIYDTEYINTLTRTFSRFEADNEINLWSQHNQIIVSLDSLKPIESRQGWSKQKIDEYNKYRIQNVLYSSTLIKRHA